MISWTDYYIGIAQAAKLRSKDPVTQVGAVLVSSDNRIISLGYNGMPEGMNEISCWHEDCKDDLVIHAEVNCVGNAARSGVSTKDATIYLTLPPCLPCCRIIAAAGVAEVVFPREAYLDWVGRKPKWWQRFDAAFNYLTDSKIEWKMA